MKTKIGQVAALGLLMITTAALAQSKPVAGEVAEGSLKARRSPSSRMEAFIRMVRSPR